MFIAIAKLFKNLFALRPGKLIDYFWALLGPALIVMLPWSALVGPSEEKPLPVGLERIYDIISGPHTPAFYTILVSVCIIGPIMEELAFRGVFWRFFEKFIDKHYAFFLTSIFFAYFHVDPIHIVGVMPIGIYIGWLRLKSNSIFPSIVAHIANNTFVSLSLITF